jgi:hypothetical protein
MLNVVFWNINRKPLRSLLATLVRNHNIDLLVLAENQMASATILAALNREREIRSRCFHSFFPISRASSELR